MNYLKLTTLLLLIMIVTNCKDESKISLSEFKYADKNFEVKCDGISEELLKEALFSFEEDISNHFSKNGQKNLVKAYSSVINLGMYGRGKYGDIVSDHTKAIFEELKKDESLWNTKGKIKSLNYNHELVKCLANNIKDKDINTSFNALLSTNSMRLELLSRELRTRSARTSKDQHLATYIALDYLYAKLFDVDFSVPKKEKVEVPKLKINRDEKPILQKEQQQ